MVIFNLVSTKLRLSSSFPGPRPDWKKYISIYKSEVEGQGAKVNPISDTLSRAAKVKANSKRKLVFNFVDKNNLEILEISFFSEPRRKRKQQNYNFGQRLWLEHILCVLVWPAAALGRTNFWPTGGTLSDTHKSGQAATYRSTFCQEGFNVHVAYA